MLFAAYAAEAASALNVSVLLQRRGTGLVNTVGVFKGSKATREFERDHMRAGVVYNDDGVTPSPIVHQYDRILKSTGHNGLFGSSPALLRLKAVDEALGRVEQDATWLVAGA